MNLPPLPERPNYQQMEQDWRAFWAQKKTYAWDATKSRQASFVVDTPPPTVSGSLHIGHVFSYTHTDTIVRFQRMMGKNIFYPMGWDDNGLPTERRVQNVFNIKCNPALPYDPNWHPVLPEEGNADSKQGSKNKKDKTPALEVSRQNFLEACATLTALDEKAYQNLWQRLGLSVDWSLQYATIDDNCRKISQASFLDLVEKGRVYATFAPNMWDIDFQTAVAQAELEDRQVQGNFHDIRFQVEGGGDFIISTTRPELLASCIAVVAHPDDERYQPLFGKKAITPLFNVSVPILPANHADPEKGTGILMVCTFGDIMDVEFWKHSGLPIRQTIGRNGRMLDIKFGEDPFPSNDPAQAQKYYDQIKGLTTKQAKQVMANCLKESGALVGDLKPTLQAVKYYEKGERPLEFIPTRQWYIKILDKKAELLAQGKKIKWHPDYMYTRYEHWVEGLNQDWCISRQRYFGVPFPVSYPVQANGEPDYEHPIFAKKEQLPVDPMIHVPEGYKEEQRGVPGGFTADKDVMDTWATSSVSPQLTTHWPWDQDRHQKLFPMDVRPQSHEIIRTWAFYTIVKSLYHEGKVPWHHVCISGWILDPDRKKMSKSKGKTITPESFIDQYTADAVRYWAAKARPGVDTAFDEKQFKIGQKILNKLFNASKFVLQQIDHLVEQEQGSAGGKNEGISLYQRPLDFTKITYPIDQAWLQIVSETINAATKAFQEFDYATALQVTEERFWNFCDHYLELVKHRSYQDQDKAGQLSAALVLSWSLQQFLKLFAPFFPYLTEEIWHWRFSTGESIHRSLWPKAWEIKDLVPAQELFDTATTILAAMRGAKTSQQKNLRWPIEKMQICATAALQAVIKQVEDDLYLCGNVQAGGITYQPEADGLKVEVTLAAENPAEKK
ncbi:MAG: valine--tRNA ligase [Bacteriovoracaceae bacterium]|nr:valine--tRNA ligase [Bacteriovoracaceae bacterium]